MKEYSKRPWSIRERVMLKEHYSKMSVVELQETHLPRRTENSIRKQVAYLRKRGWTF
jgi:hypothetical protein